MAYNYNNNNNNLFYNTSNNKNTFNNKINSDKDFSGEPILVYDSFYSDSDDQEKGINNKNKKNLTKKKGKNKGTFYKITKQEKDQKKMDEDNNAMLQRVGSRRKTIVVQDETGKELSRIVSSTGNQDPNLMRRASFLAPPPMYPQPFTVQASQPPQFYSQPQPYPQPQLIMQAPPPPYQAPILVRAPAPQTVVLDNSYFTQRGSILNQIQEEPIKNDKRVKSSIINAINVTNSNKIIDAETLEAKHKTKFKRGDFIFCCEFCPRPTTTTCECCCKICACPCWWSTIIGFIIFLTAGALIAVIVLLYTGTIKASG